MDSTGTTDLKMESAGCETGRLLRSLACLAFFGGIAAGPALAAPLSTPACMQGGASASVAGVTPDFGVKLADGREILLAGIDAWRPADDPDAAKASRTLAAWIIGKPILIRPLAAEPDRWGRVAALAFAPVPDTPGSSMVSVAEALIGAGLARARPDARLTACWTTFLTQERTARAVRLGLWAEPRYAVIAANDRPRLRASSGSMAIVEGSILRTIESRARTYLLFGDRGRDDFALSIQRPLLNRWRAAGIDPAAWNGRAVQARGFLDDRFGMQIELTSVDQIEFTAPQ